MFHFLPGAPGALSDRWSLGWGEVLVLGDDDEEDDDDGIVGGQVNDSRETDGTKEGEERQGDRQVIVIGTHGVYVCRPHGVPRRNTNGTGVTQRHSAVL